MNVKQEVYGVKGQAPEGCAMEYKRSPRGEKED